MVCWPIALPAQGNTTLLVFYETCWVSANAAFRLFVAHDASLAPARGFKPHNCKTERCSVCSLNGQNHLVNT